MKKTLAVLLATLMLAAFLAACSTANDEPTPATPTTSASTETEPPADNPPPPSSPVTVTYITYQANERERVEAALNFFMEQNENIIMDTVFYPDNTYSDILKTLFVSNDAPDLFQVWVSPDLDEFVRAGYVADITDTAGARKIMPGIRGILQETEARKDGIYALPEGLAGLGMIANMTVLKQAGVDTYPETYDAFVEACEKVQALGIQPIAYGDAEATSSVLFSVWGFDVVADDASIAAMRTGTVPSIIDQPFMTDIFERTLNLRQFFINGWSGITFSEAGTMVAKGEAAFVAHGQWGLTDMRAAASPDAEFVFGPLPLGDRSRPLVTISGGISMSSTAKERDAAITYLNFFASDDYFRLFQASAPVGFEGVNVDLAAEDLAFQRDYAPYANSQSSVPVTSFTEAMYKPLQELLAGLPLADALARAEEFYTS